MTVDWNYKCTDGRIVAFIIQYIDQSKHISTLLIVNKTSIFPLLLRHYVAIKHN